MAGRELSVIVTTYERPEPLARVIEGFVHQTFADFELVISDDGSGMATREVIERAKMRAPIPIVHVRQEHDGFRAAAARNMGIRASSGKWIVFVDGDCVPFPDFVATHARRRARGRFLAGDRYLLEQDEAARVSVDAVASGAAFAETPSRERHRLLTLRAKNAFYTATMIKRDRPKLLTANVSLARADLDALNGLDERYRGWGREDDDLRRRMVRSGLKVKSVVGLANLLHLWHPPVASFAGKVRAGPNEPYFRRGWWLTRCRRGLVDRPLSDLTIAIASPDAELARGLRAALGAREPTHGKVEVEIAIDPGAPAPAPSFRHDADVRVVVQAGPLEAARASNAHLVLHGGEDPASELPVHARPARGLGRTTLDGAALDAAAKLLDEMI